MEIFFGFVVLLIGIAGAFMMKKKSNPKGMRSAGEVLFWSALIALIVLALN